MSRELLRPAGRHEDLQCRSLARRARGFWLLLLVHPLLAVAECPEKPSLWLDEPTAASHLVTRRDAELPAGKVRLRGVQRVVLLVTVDREGRICQAKAVSGREDLRALAATHVKKYWRYRPFLLNWKPAMAQFPVTLKFFPRKETSPEQRIAVLGDAAMRAAGTRRSARLALKPCGLSTAPCL
jgi:hypothetical protein